MESVSVHVDRVDVRCAAREACLQDPRPLGDQRESALDDFLARDRALRNPGFPGLLANQIDDRRIRFRFSVVTVHVPALAGFLAQPPGVDQQGLDQRTTFAGPGEMAERLLRSNGDIDPRHVIDANIPMAMPKPVTGRVHLLRGRALFDRCTALRTCTETSCGCDKARPVPDDHPDFTELLCQRDDVASVGRTRWTRTMSSSRITFAGSEEMQPDDWPGRDVAEASASTSSVEVLVAITRPDLQPGRAVEDLPLQRQVLEDGLDHDVGGLEPARSSCGVMRDMRSATRCR